MYTIPRFFRIFIFVDFHSVKSFVWAISTINQRSSSNRSLLFLRRLLYSKFRYIKLNSSSVFCVWWNNFELLFHSLYLLCLIWRTTITEHARILLQSNPIDWDCFFFFGSFTWNHYINMIWTSFLNSNQKSTVFLFEFMIFLCLFPSSSIKFRSSHHASHEICLCDK